MRSNDVFADVQQQNVIKHMQSLDICTCISQRVQMICNDVSVFVPHAVSLAHCNSIAQLRRSLQRVDKSRLLFLDETHARIGIAPSHTLVAPGGTAYVLVDDTTAYARRYDMIACCSANRVFPSCIYTPDERARVGVRGITQAMLLDYIERYLAHEVSNLGRSPVTLVIDKSTIHNVDKMKQAFRNGGCQNISDIVLMPAQAAKRMSPLDNSLFNTWKSNIKRRGPVTDDNIVDMMYDEWEKLTASDIQPNYSHCLLMQRQNVYGDCPDPASHRH